MFIRSYLRAQIICLNSLRSAFIRVLCTDIYPIEDFVNPSTSIVDSQMRKSTSFSRFHTNSIMPVKLLSNELSDSGITLTAISSICPCIPFVCIHGVHIPKADDLKSKYSLLLLRTIYMSVLQ